MLAWLLSRVRKKAPPAPPPEVSAPRPSVLVGDLARVAGPGALEVYAHGGHVWVCLRGCGCACRLTPAAAEGLLDALCQALARADREAGRKDWYGDLVGRVRARRPTPL